MTPWEWKALFLVIVLLIIGCIVVLAVIGSTKLSRSITPHDELEPIDPQPVQDLDDWFAGDDPMLWPW